VRSLLPRFLSGLASVAAVMALSACAPAAAPCPAVPPPAPPPVATAPPADHPAPPALDADIALLLRPTPGPAAFVHVEVTLPRGETGTMPWRIVRGAPERVVHATAHDGSGDATLEVAAAAPGVELRPSRALGGATTIAYDVLVGDDAPDDPLGLLVVDDRFRGAGERLVALPASATAEARVLLKVDGDPLRASGGASSLGVGAVRRATVPARALQYASYISGSLGGQVIDDPAAGHDEGAWLGYTAFDPRPTVAELSQFRSSLRELLKSQDRTPETYLFVSQTRPIGSFTSTPRWSSVLLQVGPGEPWSASLRLSMAQQLARRWIGGELRIATEPGHEAEGWWFSEGVSRYVATVLLARLGSLTPDDVRDVVAGELSVLATSPHRALDNAHLAELASKDETARATLMARGALYALRESAALRAHTKKVHLPATASPFQPLPYGLPEVLSTLVQRAEEEKQGTLAVSAWRDALGRDDPDAGKTFDALVAAGAAPQLPPDALGPCFRPGTGEYVAYDPGFDVEATRASKDGRVVGVRAGGPAGKAGLAEGDVVESMQGRDGSSDVPVKITVDRAGTKKTLTYSPRGAHGRGQTWTRVPGLKDDKCGDVL
jgi:hypothetical protein